MNDTKNSPPSSQMSAKGAGQRSGLGFSIAVALLLIALVTGSAFGVQSLLRLVNPPITVAPLSPKAVELTQQLAERRAREATQLSSYGWVDKESGIARIPIAQAITLLAGQGLPVGIPPTATTTTATAITTTATTTTDTVDSDSTPAAPAVDLTNLNYQDHILPIFEAHCSKCHGTEEPEEGLTLTTFKGAMAGSLYGRVIAPGDPDNSYLVELVVNGKMPKRGDPLSQSEIDMVVAWIKAGAPESGDGTSAPIAASTPLTESTPVAEATPTTESAAITPTVVATHTVDLANVSFTNDVLPIFMAHCAECHGDDNPEEGLELTSYKKLMNGSLNGGVIKKGDPDNSYLVKMIVEGKMPKRALVKGDFLKRRRFGEIEDVITAAGLPPLPPLGLRQHLWSLPRWMQQRQSRQTTPPQPRQLPLLQPPHRRQSAWRHPKPPQPGGLLPRRQSQRQRLSVSQRQRSLQRSLRPCRLRQRKEQPTRRHFLPRLQTHKP